DRRIEPDVEILLRLAGDLEAEVRRVAGDVPVLQAGLEPLADFVRDLLLHVPRAQPRREAIGEEAETEEEMARRAPFGRRVAVRAVRIAQIARRVRRRTDLACVAV